MFVPRKIQLWLLISSLIVSWDCLFVLLQPRTLPGGPLHVFFMPYGKYIEIDTLYSIPGERFLVLQSTFNCFEILLAWTALGLLRRKAEVWQCTGSLLAFAVSAFTFWKTCIYWGYDADFLKWETPVLELLGVFLIPNLCWIFMPLISMVAIGKRIWKAVCERPKTH